MDGAADGADERVDVRNLRIGRIALAGIIEAQSRMSCASQVGGEASPAAIGRDLLVAEGPAQDDAPAGHSRAVPTGEPVEGDRYCVDRGPFGEGGIDRGEYHRIRTSARCRR